LIGGRVVGGAQKEELHPRVDQVDYSFYVNGKVVVERNLDIFRFE
jgi:hypothetical protein